MQSIAYIPGSDGAANASLMTISTVRAPLASTIIVNTVANVPDKFYASMGTPNTFIDPVTGETITVISEATAVDFAGHVDGSNIEIDAIAPGYTDNGSAVGDIIVIRPVTEWANNIFNILRQSHNDDGTIKNTAIPNIQDHIQSGGIWSLVSGLNGTMTALVGFQSTTRGTIAAVASRTFTPSKDTYVDVLRNTTTQAFSLVYTEVNNGAAAPALAANSIRLARVITDASTITSVVQHGFDSLNNPIKPTTNPRPKYYFVAATDNLAVVAPFDCIFEVEHVENNIWGFGGGSVVMSIPEVTGLTSVGETVADIINGDTIGRQLRASKIFEGGKAGVSYTFGVTYAGNPQNRLNKRKIVKCIPA